jgi:hypothetical protein
MSSMAIHWDRGLSVMYLRAFRSPTKWRGPWAALGWMCSLPPTSLPPCKPASKSAPVAGHAASLCTQTGYVSGLLQQSSKAVPQKAPLIGPQLTLLLAKICAGCSSTCSVSLSVSVDHFSGVQQPGRESDHYLHLGPRTRIGGTMPLLPPYVFK